MFLLRISSLAGKGMKVATFKDGRQSNVADTRSQSSLIALEKNFMRNVPIWNQFRKIGAMGAVDVENPFPFSANRVQKGIDPQRSRPKVRFGSLVSILSDRGNALGGRNLPTRRQGRILIETKW